MGERNAATQRQKTIRMYIYVILSRIAVLLPQGVSVTHEMGTLT